METTQPQTTSAQPPLLLRIFPKALRAGIAANIPEWLSQNITLGSDWYDHNGHFKFRVGDKIDCKGPQYCGYGLNPQGWTVVGYTEDGKYIIETAEGEQETHFKWNIENQFKPANPDAQPFDPERFRPESARRLGRGEAV